MPDTIDPLPHDPSKRGSTAALLRSVMPALDLAFGLDDPVDFCGEMASVLARLHAGPLGASEDIDPGTLTGTSRESVPRPQARTAPAALAA